MHVKLEQKPATVILVNKWHNKYFIFIIKYNFGF